MGGLTSFASTAVQALSLANNVVGGIRSYNDDSGKRDYEQIKQKNALELANLQQRNDLDKEANRLDAQRLEAERRSKLRSAIAKRRASFGASGIETETGSGEAVLLGLYNLSEEEKAQNEALETLKNNILDSDLNARQRINTLELTQQKERKKLSRAGSALKSLTSIF